MTETKTNKKGKILIICGATASGKSQLAARCASLLNSEIISADALDVYRGLNIGTAKPTADEMQGIKHHLFDVVDANKTFSVGDYRELARPIVDGLIKAGKIPVICGGTGFYINSILYDFSYGNSAANLAAREKYMCYENLIFLTILQDNSGFLCYDSHRRSRAGLFGGAAHGQKAHSRVPEGGCDAQCCLIGRQRPSQRLGKEAAAA